MIRVDQKRCRSIRGLVEPMPPHNESEGCWIKEIKLTYLGLQAYVLATNDHLFESGQNLALC